MVRRIIDINWSRQRNGVTLYDNGNGPAAAGIDGGPWEAAVRRGG